MKDYRFIAKIKESIGGGSYIEFPFSVEECFGVKGRVPVICYFDGIQYRGSLANMGDGCHIIGVLKTIIKQLNKTAGDQVEVLLRYDLEERIVIIPKELEDLLNRNNEEKEFFNSLSYSNRKEYAEYIKSAKQEVTKLNRLEKVLEMLQRKEKKIK